MTAGPRPRCSMFAITWAHARGLDRLIEYPRGFSVFDGLGLLVRGFEHRPAFGLPYNLPYYPTLVEAAGFAGTEDILSGYLTAEMAFPADPSAVGTRSEAAGCTSSAAETAAICGRSSLNQKTSTMGHLVTGSGGVP